MKTTKISDLKTTSKTKYLSTNFYKNIHAITNKIIYELSDDDACSPSTTLCQLF